MSSLPAINIIGNTPIVKITNLLSNSGAQVFVELEEFNMSEKHQLKKQIQG